MAKIVKKKRKLKLQNLMSMLFVISLFAYLGSTFVLRSMNYSMNIELTDLNIANQENQKELDTLRLDVAKYTDREYLMSICKANGVDLSFNIDRITYVDSE